MINILNELGSVSWAILRKVSSRKEGVSASELSREIKQSQPTCFREFAKLERLRIVSPRYAGNVKIYTLQNNYIVTKIILPTIHSEKKYFIDLKKNIVKQLSVYTKAIIIFGSYANYSNSYESDLDLCVVLLKRTKKIEGLVHDFLYEIGELFSVNIEPYILTRDEFQKKEELEVIQNIKDKGKFLYGDRQSLLLR